MKIDLHVHTKKVLDSEFEDRNIDKDNFIKTLKENGVGIAAITNHNIFDLKQYESFKSDDDFMLLPGCELDVEIDGKRKQINVITSPKNAEAFEEIIRKLNNSYKNLIKWDPFIETFNSNNYILYPDFKRGKTSFNENNFEKLNQKADQAIVLADTNSAKTLMVLKAHYFNALIGSDIKDWSKYASESRKLLDTKLNIESFETFVRVLKYDTSIINDIFKNIQSKKINKFIMNKTKYEIKNLEIKTGVNIIFGAKRTGKTEIIKEISKQLGERAITYFSSDGIDANLKKLSDKYKKVVDSFEGHKHKYKILLKNISHFQASTFKDFHNFFKSEDGNKSKIEFCKKWETSSIDPYISNKKSIKELQDISEHINNLWKLLSNSGFSDKNLNLWEKTFKDILQESMIKYKNIFSNYWKMKINLEIKNEIQKISENFNGTILRPSSIGLMKRYEEKSKYLNDLEEVLNFKKEYEFTIKELNIPNRGTIYANQYLYFLKFSKEKSVECVSAIHNKVKTLLQQINGMISSINYTSNFFELSKLIADIIKNKDIFLEEVRLIDNKKASDFSNGEIAHMTLFEVLDDNKEYYLLDEPGVYLGSKSISESLLVRLGELVKANKTIVIATHNSSIGVNSIPTNYILRKYENGNDECQTYMGSIWENKFTNIQKISKKHEFVEAVINNFEGGRKHFSFRKEVYDDKNN